MRGGNRLHSQLPSECDYWQSTRVYGDYLLSNCPINCPTLDKRQLPFVLPPCTAVFFLSMNIIFASPLLSLPIEPSIWVLSLLDWCLCFTNPIEFRSAISYCSKIDCQSLVSSSSFIWKQWQQEVANENLSDHLNSNTTRQWQITLEKYSLKMTKYLKGSFLHWRIILAKIRTTCFSWDDKEA